MKTNQLIIIGIIIVLIAGGIYVMQKNTNVEESAETTTTENTITKEETYRVVIDEYGRTVEVPTNVSRIIVLDSGSAEIIYTLGKGDLIVGRLDRINFPPSILDAEPIGYVGGGVDIEKIMTLNPDVIVTFVRSQKELETLEEHGIPVIGVTWTNSIEDLYGKIRLLGEALGVQDRAEYVISYLQDKVNEIAEITGGAKEKPTVLFIRTMGNEGAEIITRGIENELIDLAGGISLSYDPNATSERININYEKIIELNPDVIILSYRASLNPEDLLNDERLASVTAIKEDRVYKIPSEYKPSSPRFILLLAYMAKAIHPDLMKDYSVNDLRTEVYQQLYNLAQEDIEAIGPAPPEP